MKPKMQRGGGQRTPLAPGYPALRLGAARWAAALVALIALTVLAGWALDIARLRSAIPGAVEMKANTALALLLCALALGLLTREPTAATERGALAASVAVTLIGVATLSQYVFGWDLHIDEALFRDTGSAFNDARGRMSPYTATTFAAVGLALAALPRSELRPLLWGEPRSRPRWARSPRSAMRGTSPRSSPTESFLRSQSTPRSR